MSANFVPTELTWLWRASWQAAVLALLVVLCQIVFRKQLAPRWRFALWWIVVLRLLLPVVPPSAWSVFNLAKLVPGRTFYASKSSVSSTKAAPDASASLVPSPPRPRASAVRATPLPHTLFKPLPDAPTPFSSPSRPSDLSGSNDLLASAPSPSAMVEALEVPPATRPDPTPESPVASPFKSWSMRHWITLIWLLGTILCAARLALGSFWLARQLRGSSLLIDPNILSVLRACREIMRVKKPLEVTVTPKVDSPALFGLWRLKLLIPPRLTQTFSANEWKHVFLHELAHVRRWDVVLNWFMAALQAVHWFNPLLWLAFRRLRDDRELACDAMTLGFTADEDRKAYGQTILKLLDPSARPMLLPGLVGILENRAQLKRRITMIAGYKKNNRRPLVALVLILGLGFIGLTDNRAQERGSGVPEDKSQISSRGGPVGSSISTTTYSLAPSLGPTLSVVRTADGLSITFAGTLQFADDLAGPWIDMAVTSPATVALGREAGFYRSRQDAPRPAEAANSRSRGAVFSQETARSAQSEAKRILDIASNGSNSRLGLAKINRISASAEAPDSNGQANIDSSKSNGLVHTGPGRQATQVKLDSLKPAASTQLHTKVYRLDPNTFLQNLMVVLWTNPVTGETRVFDPLNIQQAVRQFFTTATGVNFCGGTPGPRDTSGNGSVGSRDTLLPSWLRQQSTVGGSITAANATKDGLPRLLFLNGSGHLYVRATLDELELVEQAIQVLNLPPPQVELEAKFVEITQEDNKALGFDWFLGNFLMGGGNMGVPGGTASSLQGTPTAANPSDTAPTSDTFPAILTDPQFRIVIHALEQRSGIEVMSAPRVVTLSGRQAQIHITVERQTPAGTSAAIAIPKGPSLDIIPNVKADGYTIQMTLIPSVVEFLGYSNPDIPEATESERGDGKRRSPIPLPRLQVRQLRATNCTLWDGQTVVLGGLVSDRVPPQRDKVSVLSALPVVGRLFRSETKGSARKNFVVFITARIIDPAGNRVHTDDNLPDP